LPVRRQGHVFILDRVIGRQSDDKMGQQDGTAIVARLYEFGGFVSQEGGVFVSWIYGGVEPYAQASQFGDAVYELGKFS
jgi:hypothetical protein